MDIHIFIALIAVLINLVLSTVIPSLLKEKDNESNQTFMSDIKKVFITNKQLIVSSSLILGLIVYIALKIAPSINNTFTDLTGMSFNNNNNNNINDLYNNIDNNIIDNTIRNIPPNYSSNILPLKYLLKLRN